MKINLFLVPFVMIIGLLFINHDTKKNRLLYIILCCIAFLLVAVLRSPEWMTHYYHIDTLVYKQNFESIIEMKWGELWTMAYERYFAHGDEGDIGYLFLTKIISWFTHDFYIYSFLVDLIFFIPFGVIIYRYTTNIIQIIFALLFYIALVQIFIISGARQISSIGLDMMALLSLLDKKIGRAILLVCLGVTIHFSSILFLLPLLMIWKQTKPATLKWFHIVCFFLFPIVLAFPNQIIVFMGESVGMEKYALYGEGDVEGGIGLFVVLIELMSLFCLIAIKKQNLVEFYVYRVFYVMTPLFTFFAPLIRSNGSMIRISLYYHIFLMLLVPYAIDCMFKKETRSAIYSIAIIALAVLTVSSGGITYYFFWQQ